MAGLAGQTQPGANPRGRREPSQGRDDRGIRAEGGEGAQMTDIRESIAEITSTVVAKQRDARDPVNEPTIKTWVEALGDRNPIYTDEAAARAAGHPGLVAPPAM